MGRVEGKVAIVTGGASGIGRAAATLLAAEGAAVMVTDIDVTGGEEVVQAITEKGGKAVFRKQDVVDEARWIEVVKDTVEAFGKVDILLNNAGIGVGGPTTEMTLDAWRNIMAINVDSVFLGTKHVIPAMKEAGGGSIINISSVAGLKGAAGLAAYNATKGAVRLFTKGVARECAADGNNIRVNSVHPGIIDTAIWGKIADTDLPEGSALTQQAEGANAPDVEMIATLAQVPVGRAGQATEIAEGVVFLASDASRYMTGTELIIDGGMTC